MTACGMISFGGLLSEQLPCFIFLQFWHFFQFLFQVQSLTLSLLFDWVVCSTGQQCVLSDLNYQCFVVSDGRHNRRHFNVQGNTKLCYMLICYVLYYALFCIKSQCRDNIMPYMHMMVLYIPVSNQRRNQMTSSAVKHQL